MKMLCAWSVPRCGEFFCVRCRAPRRRASVRIPLLIDDGKNNEVLGDDNIFIYNGIFATVIKTVTTHSHELCVKYKRYTTEKKTGR